jgi:hypothetical protein
MLVRGGAVFFADAGSLQRLGHAPLAVPPPRQRLRFGKRIGRIVDITLCREAVRNRLRVRLAGSVPAALAKLAREIEAQLRTRRCEAPDIA